MTDSDRFAELVARYRDETDQARELALLYQMQPLVPEEILEGLRRIKPLLRLGDLTERQADVAVQLARFCVAAGRFPLQRELAPLVCLPIGQLRAVLPYIESFGVMDGWMRVYPRRWRWRPRHER